MNGSMSDAFFRMNQIMKPTINPAAPVMVAIQATPKASGGYSSPVHCPFKYSAYNRPATILAEISTIVHRIIYTLNIFSTYIITLMDSINVRFSSFLRGRVSYSMEFKL